MDDFIRRQDAIELCDWYEHEFSECEYAIRPIADDIKKLPSAETKYIFCRECKWARYHGIVDKQGNVESFWWCINWDGGTNEKGYCYKWEEKTNG